MKPIGIFGGTFDPVHFGHLRVILEILENFDLAELCVVPCKTPPIKDAAIASSKQRLEMLQLALEKQKNVSINDIEIKRDGPSYTFDTLSAFKNKSPDKQLLLVLGTDAFLSLNHWYKWQEILNLTHIIVIHRPGWNIDGDQINKDIKSLLKNNLVNDKSALNDSDAGKILLFPIRKLDISSSGIRKIIADGKSPHYLLPQIIADYISKNNLYFKNQLNK